MKKFILPFIIILQVYANAQESQYESFESLFEKEFEQNSAIREKFISAFKKLRPSDLKKKDSFIKFFILLESDLLKPLYLEILQDDSHENFIKSILPRIKEYNDTIFNQPLIDLVKKSMRTFRGRTMINGSLYNIEKTLDYTDGDALNRLEKVITTRKNNIYSQIWALKTRYYKDREGTETILKKKFPGYDLKEVFDNPKKVIKRGRAGTELVLVLALHKHGLFDFRMLEALANSGNEYLLREAEDAIKGVGQFNSSSEGNFGKWGRN